MGRHRRVIYVDLDGTLAEYLGWVDDVTIGSPIPAMVDKVRQALARGDVVRIFTARASRNGAVVADAIQAWLIDAGLPPLDVTCIKSHDVSEIWDDRARQVVRNTGKFINEEEL